MKFAEDFESFLRTEVNLNKTRLNSLQQRVNTIESFIENDPTLGPMFVETIPAGSWAHRSIIKPVTESDGFDADLLLHLQEQTDWDPKDYIEKLYAVFRNSSTYRDMVHRKTRCMRINYAGEFHIDLVPFIERDGLNYITNRRDPDETGKLEASDPEGFTAWIDERQHITGGSFIKVVRLLKYLRDYKNTFTCKSIILTTLLGEQVNEIESMLLPDRYSDIPSTLNTLLGKLAGSLPYTMPPVMDPAGTGDNFSDRYRAGWDYENFRRQIIRYADQVRDAFEETNREASIKAWQEIFGDQFKPGSLTKIATLSPRSAGVPWQGEQFIDQAPLHLPVLQRSQYRVKIAGRCTGLETNGRTRRNGFRKYDLSSRGNQVEKHRSLLFKIVSIDVPPPYEVYWKVRNGGEEAFSKGQLRGEISRDEGNHSRKETTSYQGTHYVECYIVKDGKVVAKDRQNVIVV